MLDQRPAAAAAGSTVTATASAEKPPAPGIGSHGRWHASVRAVIAGFSLLVLLASGIAWASYKGFTGSVAHGPAVPGGSDIDGADQNILLVGSDSRAGADAAELKALGTTDDGGSVNSDTMMLMHIPANGTKASVVSIPRDSWVDIPGYGKGKMNSAYGDGWAAAKGKGENETASEAAGLLLLVSTLEKLTGLHIDHYVQVNLLGFYRISTAIGGVPICLNSAQNANTDSDAYGRGYSGINLPAGRSVIEGSQALAFVRQRHGLPQGDLDRIKRQQYFLAAAFHKITTAGVLLNPFKLSHLLNAVSSSLLTDPSLNLLTLAKQFQDIGSGNIAFTTIPNSGSQTIYPDGVTTSIVAVDTAAIPGFINQLQGKPADPALASAATAAASSVSLDVLNGTDISGLATRNATALKKTGFHVETIDSTDSTTATTVEYPNGMQSQAKAVAAAVPGAALTLTSSVTRVTLVLGSNGIQAQGVASSDSDSSASTGSGAGSANTAATSTPAVSSAPKAASTGTGCIN